MESSRCYLCTNLIPHKNSLVCADCFCFLQEEQWVSCARCGRFSCAGCEALSEFKKVVSSYVYTDTFAKILSLAKDNHHTTMQQVFTQIFFVPVKNALLKLMSQENYDYIVVSPLRKERMLKGAWHPNLFYQEVLSWLLTHEFATSDTPQILYPYYSTSKPKQSLIPSHKRGKFDAKQKLTFPSFTLTHDDGPQSRILLLDDVLTTGKTAQLCKTMSDSFFPNRKWDLYTILRAPQALDF